MVDYRTVFPLLTLILSDSVLQIASRRQCADVVDDPRSVFSQSKHQTEPAAEYVAADLVTCMDMCCDDEISCSVGVFIDAWADDINCWLYSCFPLDSCAIKIGKEAEVFVNPRFADTDNTLDNPDYSTPAYEYNSVDYGNNYGYSDYSTTHDNDKTFYTDKDTSNVFSTLESTTISTPPSITTELSPVTEPELPPETTPVTTPVGENNTSASLANESVFQNDTFMTPDNENIFINDSFTPLLHEISLENDTVTTSLNEISLESDTVTTPLNEIGLESDTVTTSLNEISLESDTVTTPLNEISLENDTVTTSLNEISLESDTVTTSLNEISLESDTVTTPLNEISLENDTVTTPLNEISSENDTSATNSSTEIEGNKTIAPSFPKENNTFFEDEYNIENDTVWPGNQLASSDSSLRLSTSRVDLSQTPGTSYHTYYTNQDTWPSDDATLIHPTDTTSSSSLLAETSILSSRDWSTFVVSTSMEVGSTAHLSALGAMESLVILESVMAVSTGGEVSSSWAVAEEGFTNLNESTQTFPVLQQSATMTADIFPPSDLRPQDSPNGTESRADIDYQPSETATGLLISALTVGCVCALAVVVVLGLRLYDGYKKRHYSRLDYLINGIYN